jgi:hypothetical protein
MAFIIDGTAGETFPDSTTQATGVPAPGTSGNVLTSNGTAWTSAAPAAGAMTLLGTITVTASNSLSLSGLTLTSYKALFMSVNGTGTAAGSFVYVSPNNVQSGGGIACSVASGYYGSGWIDLSIGAIGGFGNTGAAVTSGSWNGNTNVTTAATTIYFRYDSTNTFTAAGSIKIYGVK